MIKVLLVGCSGKMGKVILACSEKLDTLEITAGVDRKEDTSLKFPIFKSIDDCNLPVDVILDFSRPDSLDGILEFASSKKVPVVLCTTGYSEEQIEKIRLFSEQNAIFRSANMSIGINVINNLLKNISSLLYEDFDIEIIERHHNQKVDAPSGTALLLGDTIKEAIKENTNYVHGRNGNHKREHSEIGVHAIRGGSIVGEHEIIFAGEGEVIELKHTALSREVFAVGALKACLFMAKQKAGLYNMDDVLNL
jgi:4-hydroxy-tetrahydrodipicolinate reductase